jgi:hypothetical protein
MSKSPKRQEIKINAGQRLNSGVNSHKIGKGVRPRFSSYKLSWSEAPGGSGDQHALSSFPKGRCRKGGIIKRIMERVSAYLSRGRLRRQPRQSQLHAQRYIEQLPPGRVAIFDRSWYNRAGVEYVMGLYRESQAISRDCPTFEVSGQPGHHPAEVLARSIEKNSTSVSSRVLRSWRWKLSRWTWNRTVVGTLLTRRDAMLAATIQRRHLVHRSVRRQKRASQLPRAHTQQHPWGDSLMPPKLPQGKSGKGT